MQKKQQTTHLDFTIQPEQMYSLLKPKKKTQKKTTMCQGKNIRTLSPPQPKAQWKSHM